ncbi:MAG: M13 family metallopeptidase, partial [Pseudomonadota bacterium]
GVILTLRIFFKHKGFILNKLSILCIAIALLLSGCNPPQNTQKTDKSVEPATESTVKKPAEIGAWGVDLTGMDKNVVPGNDFHRYVNGGWIKQFEIPPDKSRWGIFNILGERSTEQIHKIVTELSAGEVKPGSLEQKVGDYYSTWMDTEAINAKGLAPLKKYLAEIAEIKDRDGLMKYMTNLYASAPMGVGILPDFADTTKYTIAAVQAGLGMPDRDYYLKEDEQFAGFRESYKAYMAKVQELAGIADAASKTEAIFNLEYKLAQVHWSKVDNRNIKKIYNPMTPGELVDIAPEIDWKMMLKALGLGEPQNIIVFQPSAITASAKIFAETSVDTWKDYLAFHFIDSNAPFLPEAFDNANFEFYSKTLRGIEAQRERWKRGSDLVNRNLGEAVGKVYTDKHFPPEAKRQMDELVANLSAALKERLEKNEWMDEQTRQQALLKLSTFEPRIGYTKKWTDYSKLKIEKGDMLGNAIRLTEFEWQQDLERLPGPVDRERWPYPPQTVNASYSPLLNQITFPAGILQPPFFDPNADPAINYGAIGVVIGHEIGHGFDDQGRRFDENGVVRDWWTEASGAAFKVRADKLVEQFNQYSPIEGMTVNGKLTLGENIGDLGGVEMAYAAYQKYKEKYGEPEIIDGYTGDQRFFLSYGQIWRGKIREDALRQRLVTDPHSPMEFRINGVVRNVDAWYEAFGVKTDNALYLPPEQRVSIW